MTSKRHAQPRIPGGRDPLGSSVDPRIRAWVEREARFFNCSRSWIISVALGEVSGVDVMKPPTDKKRKR